MATAVAALLERRDALVALRRALSVRDQPVYTARTPAHLDALLRRHLIDAVVLGADAVKAGTFAALRDEFGAIPVFCLAPIRSDDAGMIRRLERSGARVLVEGVDEPIAATRLRRHGLTARREDALLPLTAALRLETTLQRDVWGIVVAEAPRRLTTAALAERIGISRETLSRRFSAGGAPRLKRVIDAVRLVAAGQLLSCRGYRVADVAELLGYSSVGLLQRTARHGAASSARGLAGRPAEDIVLRAVGAAPIRWA